MAKGNNPKHKEHHIPRMYLDRFAVEGVNKPSVWQYDLINGRQTPVPVSTDSICMEYDLYEFKDGAGEYLYQNRLEDHLGSVEGIISGYFRKIENKAKLDDNLYTRTFLNKKEKATILLFLALHLVRSPEAFTHAEAFLPILFREELKDYERRNIAKFLCLEPFVNSGKPIDEDSLLGKTTGLFADMGFVVWRTDKPSFFTSDQFLQLYPEDPQAVEETEEIVKPGGAAFPLSPTVSIWLAPKKDLQADRRNKLLVMPEYLVKETQARTVIYAKRWLYSSVPFSEEQIAMIKDIRQKRI